MPPPNILPKVLTAPTRLIWSAPLAPIPTQSRYPQLLDTANTPNTIPLSQLSKNKKWFFAITHYHRVFINRCLILAMVECLVCQDHQFPVLLISRLVILRMHSHLVIPVTPVIPHILG